MYLYTSHGQTLSTQLSFGLGYFFGGCVLRSRLFVFLLCLFLRRRMLRLHREAPVEALHVRKHALPVRILHANHVFDVQQRRDVRQLPATAESASRRQLAADVDHLIQSTVMSVTQAPETGARKLASVSGAGFSRQLQNFWRQKPTWTNKK